ncbi:MAG: protein-export chaperone SecB [Gammaproteobacteria bacterium RIFCSPHIGHO2_02_FULL_42_13]|nr:MAG: protein-export chaperone SecB [Gammaproteobacteria bacterium RIFCSPHIGHO2_02_FULL_42_13]
MPPKAQPSSVNIKKIYLKGSTFQPKNVPGIFSQTGKEVQQLQIQVRNRASSESDSYEVSMKLTVAAKKGDFEAYTVQVEQAGEFELKGFDEVQKKQILETLCPNMLYPYATAAVADLVTKGGFPALLLAPMNFDQVYQQRVAQQARASARPAPAAGVGLFASPGAGGEDSDKEEFLDPAELLPGSGGAAT